MERVPLIAPRPYPHTRTHTHTHTLPHSQQGKTPPLSDSSLTSSLPHSSEQRVMSVPRRLAASFAVWLVCYYLMALLGGSVAFYRFPRQPTNDPQPYTLLDVGFQLLPEYCPKHVFPMLHLNFQSVVLVIFYLYALLWAILHIHRGDRLGAVMLTRFCLVNSLVFVTRTSVVGLTALPQPNFGKHCSNSQTEDVSYWEAVVEVCSNFPPKACGDLIYSGHVACAFCALFIFDSLQAYPPLPMSLPPQLIRGCFYGLGAMAVLSCLLCRSHYTVDVVLGIYFAYFLSVFYLQRANGLVAGGRLGDFIRMLEGVAPTVTAPPLVKDVSIPADNSLSLDSKYIMCCSIDRADTPTDSISTASMGTPSPEGYESNEVYTQHQQEFPRDAL